MNIQFQLGWSRAVESVIPPDYESPKAEMISVLMPAKAETNLLWKKDFPICVMLDSQWLK